MMRYSNWLVALMVVTGLAVASNADAQKKQMKDYVNQLQKNMDAVIESFGEGKCEVNLVDSTDGDGQDVEMRVTMPLKRFEEEFVPIAAMEAASLHQRFKIIMIWLRHKGTNKVARIWYRDAEPLARKYLANKKDPEAISKLAEDMKESVRWQ